MSVTSAPDENRGIQKGRLRPQPVGGEWRWNWDQSDPIQVGSPDRNFWYRLRDVSFSCPHMGVAPYLVDLDDTTWRGPIMSHNGRLTLPADYISDKKAEQCSKGHESETSPGPPQHDVDPLWEFTDQDPNPPTPPVDKCNKCDLAIGMATASVLMMLFVLALPLIWSLYTGLPLAAGKVLFWVMLVLAVAFKLAYWLVWMNVIGKKP